MSRPAITPNATPSTSPSGTVPTSEQGGLDLLFWHIPFSTISAALGVVLLLVVLALILFIGLWLWERGRPRTPAPRPMLNPGPSTPWVAPPTAPMPALPFDTAELDRALIRLSDLLTDSQFASPVERAMLAAGLSGIDVAIGQPFDDARQSVASTRPTPDAAAVGTVASVVRQGWQRDVSVVRPADVVIWSGADSVG